MQCTLRESRRGRQQGRATNLMIPLPSSYLDDLLTRSPRRAAARFQSSTYIRRSMKLICCPQNLGIARSCVPEQSCGCCKVQQSAIPCFSNSTVSGVQEAIRVVTQSSDKMLPRTTRLAILLITLILEAHPLPNMLPSIMLSMLVSSSTNRTCYADFVTIWI